jgi:hypothetical protein
MSETRKETAMEYEFNRNAVSSTSTNHSRHVRGGIATQCDNHSGSIDLDEPVDVFVGRSRISSHLDSPTGGPLAAFVARTFRSHAPRATVLIRLIVGGIFLTEGIQKFLFAGELGVGRFTKIGIPLPEVMAPFVRRRNRGWCAASPRPSDPSGHDSPDHRHAGRD